MANGLLDVARHTLMITGFVSMMMLVVEYLNVFSRGSWHQKLTGHRWGQYILAALLGATPGCLGAFAVVAMYSDRVLTLGATVAAMIATSGDESFVMLAMFPKRALLVTGVLFVLGIAAGVLTDAVVGKRRTRQPPRCAGFEVHSEEHCECFPRGKILNQWKACSAPRGILSVVLAVFIMALIAGQVGPTEWNWIRITLLSTSTVALFIVSTVPDHFLEEHLWDHVALKHVPRIFLWTLGALVVMQIVTGDLHLEGAIKQGKWIVLLLACLVGLVPESGPHMVFVTLYAKGAIPLSILIASSVVQDGHGMLPMLAHSRRAFFGIKAINLAAGMLFGACAMAMGF